MLMCVRGTMRYTYMIVGFNSLCDPSRIIFGLLHELSFLVSLNSWARRVALPTSLYFGAGGGIQLLCAV